MSDKNCDLCEGTGWYGDNGPGRRGNREYIPCERCNPRGEELNHDIKSDRALLDDMAEVLQKLYDHTKNNMQICGLNSIASSVLTRYDIARAKERLGCDHESIDVPVYDDKIKFARKKE